MRTSAVLLGAGCGTRMGGEDKKQYMMLGDKPLMYYAMYEFENSFIDQLVLVVPREDIDRVRKDVVEKYDFRKVDVIAPGGRERYHSVYNGLKEIKAADYIFIHDLARPFVTEDMMLRALNEAQISDAVVVGVPVRDTIRVADENAVGVDTPKRSSLWAAQTPQVFKAELIKKAYEKFHANEEVFISEGAEITDDGQVAEIFGGAKVKMIEGAYSNIKITVPEDMAAAEVILRAMPRPREM